MVSNLIDNEGFYILVRVNAGKLQTWSKGQWISGLQCDALTRYRAREDALAEASQTPTSERVRDRMALLSDALVGDFVDYKPRFEQLRRQCQRTGEFFNAEVLDELQSKTRDFRLLAPVIFSRKEGMLCYQVEHLSTKNVHLFRVDTFAYVLH